MSDRLDETAFSWEAGARQLIDRLIAVALKVEGDIPEEARIQDLLKVLSLKRSCGPVIEEAKSVHGLHSTCPDRENSIPHSGTPRS
jgi:hypothetical protein